MTSRLGKGNTISWRVCLDFSLKHASCMRLQPLFVFALKCSRDFVPSDRLQRGNDQGGRRLRYRVGSTLNIWFILRITLARQLKIRNKRELSQVEIVIVKTSSTKRQKNKRKEFTENTA
jgi:hypothetical protein